MSVRYSPQTVENAAMIAAVLASNPDGVHVGHDEFSGWGLSWDEPYAVGRALGLEGQELTDAAELFLTAWIAAFDATAGLDRQDADACAESLLRSGWLPAQGSN